MVNEVYLMCSLPYLSFGQSPPITLEDFESTARSQLSARSFRMLERMNMQGMDKEEKEARPTSVIRMMDELQQELTRIRSAWSEKKQALLANLPASVLESNPLDREIQIMQWQWDTLEGIAEGKTFTLSEVIVYKLKLQILFRMHSFSKERGQGVLDSVVNPTVEKED